MQDRNAEMVDNLVQDFPTRNEFTQSGARLSDVMMWLNRDGGGSLMWAFDGQSVACYGRGAASVWAEPNITLANYAAVVGRGGPYVALDGVNQYLNIADQPFQESTTYNFLVWSWARATTLANTVAIASKWDAQGGNWRSWQLYYYTVPAAFVFHINATGGAGAGVSIASSQSINTDTWYFVCGHFEPSTQLLIGVAGADAASVTFDVLSTGVQAQLFDGGAALMLGAIRAPAGLARYWPGDLGVGLARANVPAANIQSHITRLFHATRWFYGG